MQSELREQAAGSGREAATSRDAVDDAKRDSTGRAAEVAELEIKVRQSESNLGEMEARLRRSESELGEMEAKLRRSESELRRINQLVNEWAKAAHAADAAAATSNERARILAERLAEAEAELSGLRVRRADLTAKLQDRNRFLEALKSAWWWKLIKPLWRDLGGENGRRGGNSCGRGSPRLGHGRAEIPGKCRMRKCCFAGGASPKRATRFLACARR